MTVTDESQKVKPFANSHEIDFNHLRGNDYQSSIIDQQEDNISLKLDISSDRPPFIQYESVEKKDSSFSFRKSGNMNK